MCVLAVESSLLTPSWQGKMDGLCYRFLADTSPYNRLISYYQQPQTLKLIFIGVKKEIPHGIVDLYGSHLSMVICFFKRCVFVSHASGNSRRHTEGLTGGISRAAPSVSISKLKILKLYLDWTGMRHFLNPKSSQ